MGRLEDRLRKLEKMLVDEPTAQEYLDASNREGARALHKVMVRLASYGFDGGYLFPEGTLRMLSADTPERRERDRRITETWREAQDVEPRSTSEGPKKRLETMLGAYSTK